MQTTVQDIPPKRIIQIIRLTKIQAIHKSTPTGDGKYLQINRIKMIQQYLQINRIKMIQQYPQINRIKMIQYPHINRIKMIHTPTIFYFLYKW